MRRAEMSFPFAGINGREAESVKRTHTPKCLGCECVSEWCVCVFLVMDWLPPVFLLVAWPWSGTSFGVIKKWRILSHKHFPSSHHAVRWNLVNSYEPALVAMVAVTHRSFWPRVGLLFQMSDLRDLIVFVRMFHFSHTPVSYLPHFPLFFLLIETDFNAQRWDTISATMAVFLFVM